MPKKHCNSHKYHSTTWFQITMWQQAWPSPLLNSFWVLLVSHLSAWFPLITHHFFSAASIDPEFLCQPVGSFGDKLLCHSFWLIFNYSSTWIFLLRKDPSSSEMENPSDISQEYPLHKNSATRVWTLDSNPQFREWASCLWAFVVESGVSYL